MLNYQQLFKEYQQIKYSIKSSGQNLGSLSWKDEPTKIWNLANYYVYVTNTNTKQNEKKKKEKHSSWQWYEYLPVDLWDILAMQLRMEQKRSHW